MPFQIDGRGDMNAFVLTSPLAGVMLLTRRQPFYPSAAHDKFFSICTAFGGYTKFEIVPPYTYSGKTARVMRDADQLYIYSADLTLLLAVHDVTWSRYDSFCKEQYALPEQPEEYPSMPVKTVIKQLPGPPPDLSFEKFNFSKEDDWDD